jgi:chemotaxis family two-component system sensor kinase Cph1
MGLAVCKKIVEAHKGKIWHESQVGEGTTFYINLPQQRA